MVTAIEHHSKQQGSQYGVPSMSSSSRGPKSPSLNSPNGLVSPGRGSQHKKSRTLSLQTKIHSGQFDAMLPDSPFDTIMSESPRTALSSNGAGTVLNQELSGQTPRGTKRSVDESHLSVKGLIKTDLLEKYKGSPASFVIHLYETHFKFENQDGVFLFNSPMKIFLKCIQERTMPSGLLDIIKSAQCPYYEGRLIVEIVDHRTKGKNDGTESTKRVILTPTQGTLWADLSLLHEESGERWSNDMMLDVESKILIATEEPLCLDPSPMVTVLSNEICYNQTSATQRTRKRRKWNSLEREQEAARKAEEDKLMSMMDEKSTVDFQPNFGRLAFLKEWRQKKKMEETQSIPVLDPKKSKAKRQEMSVLPDGRKIVRTIRFEREDKKRNYKMYFMFNIMQCPDQSFEAIMRYGTAPDSAINGGIRKFNLGPEQCADAYVQSLKSMYFSANSLISDTTPTSTNTARANAAAAAAAALAASANAGIGANVSTSMAAGVPNAANANISTANQVTTPQTRYTP
ncbi:Transcription factor spt20, partial [Mortierella sp. AM989]